MKNTLNSFIILLYLLLLKRGVTGIYMMFCWNLKNTSEFFYFYIFIILHYLKRENQIHYIFHFWSFDLDPRKVYAFYGLSDFLYEREYCIPLIMCCIQLSGYTIELNSVHTRTWDNLNQCLKTVLDRIEITYLSFSYSST